jgi:hypothetical protein
LNFSTEKDILLWGIGLCMYCVYTKPMTTQLFLTLGLFFDV